ncbi:MAG: hypothetical protein DI604_32875 [Delftia acidovorans]|nr:MAG: hypothetical protein DI604_32875 [Delftia acidovorans]
MLAAAPVHPERTALTDERISFIIQETEDNSMYGRDHNGWLHQVARSVERACTAAAPQAPAAPSAHAGLLAAAAHIQAKAQAHLDERGSYDPDTGAVEMSESNQEHFNTLDELAEEIRMLAEKAAPASDQAIDQAIATHTNTEGANQ